MRCATNDLETFFAAESGEVHAHQSGSLLANRGGMLANGVDPGLPQCQSHPASVRRRDLAGYLPNIAKLE
jgi:hypothetical protein